MNSPSHHLHATNIIGNIISSFSLIIGLNETKMDKNMKYETYDKCLKKICMITDSVLEQFTKFCCNFLEQSELMEMEGKGDTWRCDEVAGLNYPSCLTQ